jgi:CO/xanthine dehydrogenase Mo-binding subunit
MSWPRRRAPIRLPSVCAGWRIRGQSTCHTRHGDARLADAALANPRPAQDHGLTGRGVAYTRYKQSENYVAMAMEVAVDPASGRIGVQRVTCAHDCGLVVNPDGLRNQIEASILQRSAARSTRQCSSIMPTSRAWTG